MNSLYAAGQAFVAAIEPWKGVIASVSAALAAGLGIVGGIVKQRRVADTTSSDTLPVAPPRGVMRLSDADRELVSELRESAASLTRAVRHLSGVMEDRP